MTKITTADFAAILSCRPPFVAVRLHAIGLGENCHRCGGSGHYSRNAIGSTTCYECQGSRVRLPALTADLLDRTMQAVAAGKLEPYLERLRQREATKKIVASAIKRVQDELYDNPLTLAIKAACKRKGKTHWSAPYQLRMEALGLPKMCDDLDGSVAKYSDALSIAAKMANWAHALSIDKPEDAAAWVATFEAEKLRVLSLAAEGLKLFSTEAWWN